MRFRRLTAALAACLLLVPAAACSQAWPAKPIRFIVPFPPGGGTDIFSRTIANKLGEALHAQVVVDNKPGAGGNIGLDAAAKSAPDGYTLVMGQTSNLAINPSLYAKVPFDPIKDFAPVSLIAQAPLVLVVAPGAPWKTVADVVAAAKARPGQLSFASPGNGTVGHLAGEMLSRSAGVKLVHVPYKGAAPAMTDLMGGQVDLYFASLGAGVAQVKGGKLRALAVTSLARTPALPDVPSIAESGYANFDANTWYGVLAPAGTPAAVVARLNAEITRMLQLPEVRERLASEGGEILGGSIERFASFLRAEHAKWSQIVKESGARVD
jgi:tripartite-type tricarboxylate transporter receptor subunit TctC